MYAGVCMYTHIFTISAMNFFLFEAFELFLIHSFNIATYLLHLLFIHSLNSPRTQIVIS